MMHEVKSPNPGELKGISAKTNEIHHDKLYAGYVNKRNEIETKLSEIDSAELEKANQSFSYLRELKTGETFTTNGMILHEIFFDILGGDGQAKGALYDAIVGKWGSFEKFTSEMAAIGMSVRGWAVLAYDPSDGKLHIFGADAHNNGSVWGATPLIPLDVYEHAYMIDFGADRKSYINAFFENLDWDKLDKRYTRVVK